MFLYCLSPKIIDLLSSPLTLLIYEYVLYICRNHNLDPSVVSFLVNEPLVNQRESVESMVYRGLVYLLMPLGYMTPTGLLHSTATDPPKRNTI